MSGFFKLNLRDFLNGLIVAVGSAVVTSLQQFFSTTGTPAPVNWKLVGGVAASTALAYLAKNLLTDNSGKTLGIEATKPTPPKPSEHDDFSAIAAHPTGQSSIEVETFPPFKDEGGAPEILRVESAPESPRLAEQPSPTAVRAGLTQVELLALMHQRDRAQAVIAARTGQEGQPAAPVAAP